MQADILNALNEEFGTDYEVETPSQEVRRGRWQRRRRSKGGFVLYYNMSVSAPHLL